MILKNAAGEIFERQKLLNRDTMAFTMDHRSPAHRVAKTK